jgi:hypothetical protein
METYLEDFVKEKFFRYCILKKARITRQKYVDKHWEKA